MPDIWSDLSAFHRVGEWDEVEDMSAERFFALSDRLIAYNGVVRARAARERHSVSNSSDTAPNEHSAPRQTSSSASGETKHYRDIHHNPELAVYFERGEG